MVYVIDISGTQLMPTNRHGKVRRLLRDGLAKVVKVEPFTIQLLYEPKTKVVHQMHLGIDASNSLIGIAAATKSQTYFAAEVELRKDIEVLLKKRKSLRSRRRYRNNKRIGKRIKKREVHRKTPQIRSRMNPTSEQKIQSHLAMIKRVTEILPIDKIIIETNQIDDLNVHVINKDYKLNKYKVKEFVLQRDEHKCIICGNKNNDIKVVSIDQPNMNKHDANNFHTLCDRCFKKYRREKIRESFSKNKTRNVSKKFIHGELKSDCDVKLGRMRFKVYTEAKKLYDNVYSSFGYKTRERRRILGEKYSPINNALILTGFTPEKPDFCYKYKLRRNHDRSLGRAIPQKNGVYDSKKTPYFTKGFSSYDKVRYNGKKYYITKKRKSGYFGLGTYDGKTLINSVKYDKLELIQKQKSYSMEQFKFIE